MNSPTSAASIRRLAAVQSAYFLLTGLWPLVHLESFLVVTGPKADIWLVETVGVLVAAIGAGLGLSAVRGRVTAEVIIVALASTLGLAIIDSIYVARGRIHAIYLLDVAVEAVLIAGWAYCMWRGRRT
ncbi:MAG: hypothetical protein WD894_02630 [Pirellulales bacterium]